MIEDLLHSNSTIKQRELKEKISKLRLNEIKENENENEKIEKINEKIENNEKNLDEKENKTIKKDSINEEIVINKTVPENERKFDDYGMEELINKREELMRNRKITTNEYYKIPHKANKEQIKKRNELEIKLDQINNDLAKIRIRMNILKSSKKK